MTSKQLRSQGLSAGAVPKGWQLVRLGDLASLRREKQKPSGNDRHPYLGLENINNWGLINSKRQFQEAISDKTVFHTGDTLYGKLRPNLRKVVRVDFDGICSTDILALFPKPLADGAFLGHILQSDRLYVHAMKGIAGTKMPRTSWDHLRAFELVCPLIPEQRAIAAVLDSIDEAIERTEAVIAATEQLRDSLLHELLTRGVPGWHTKWKEVPGLGTIPADWDVVRLGDRLEEGPTNGIYKPDTEYGSGVCLIRIDDFGFGEFNSFGNFQRIRVTEGEICRYEVREGDIVVNRVNSLSHIGKSVLIPKVNEPTLFESNMMRIRFDRNLDPRFGAMVLLSDNTRRYFKSRAKKAVQQASINQQDVSELPIPLPPLADQRTISGVLVGVDSVIEVARDEAAGLRSLKESTADALLTGRVRCDN